MFLELRDRASAALKVALMVSLLALPTVLTLATVKEPPEELAPHGTPLGYTISLTLFLVPLLVLLGWYLRTDQLSFRKRRLLWAVGWLLVLACLLEFLFASRFFEFPNPEATIGLEVPVVGGTVPIEELVFYLSGFVVILLSYVWADEVWLRRYNRDDYAEFAARTPRLLGFHWGAVGVGVALVSLAILYRKFLSGDPEGFPGYFTFLVVSAIAPAIGLYRCTRGFINWRAFSFTLTALLLVSLIWEVTLALPYGWWDYQSRSMMGLEIVAWRGLPVEAVLVWIAGAFTSIVVFEAVKLWDASNRHFRESFFGRAGP